MLIFINYFRMPYPGMMCIMQHWEPICHTHTLSKLSQGLGRNTDKQICST